MIQEKQIPNSLEVTQQYINLQFWRMRKEVLHRQASNTCRKGKGQEELLSLKPHRFCFVFILLHFHGLGLAFYYYFYVLLLFCFSKY